MLKLLEQSGLGSNESKVYLALLELGPSLVTEIAKKAGVNRTSSYDILERLVKYGLVSYSSGKGAKKKYETLPPHTLVSFLKRRVKVQEKVLTELEGKLPELKMLYKELSKPSIKFFNGIEGIKAIYKETLQAKSEILSIGDTESWSSQDLASWGREYNRERTRLKIHERILAPALAKTIQWFVNYPTSKKYTEVRFLDKNKFFRPFDGEINIFDDKVVVVLLKEPNRLGIMIESEQLSYMLKVLYELAWVKAA